MAWLKAIFWDVQHGSATWLEMPNGDHIVIDLGAGSSDPFGTFSPLRRMYENGVREIKMVILTHQHYDHLADATNLSLFDAVNYIRRPRQSAETIKRANSRPMTRAAVAWEERDRRYNQPIDHALNPVQAPRPDGASIRVFRPRNQDVTNLNNISLVTVVEYGGVKLLLPGDNEAPSWAELLGRQDFRAAIADTHVLLAPHHGRRAGFYEPLFSYITPYLTIISDGLTEDSNACPEYTARSTGWPVQRVPDGGAQVRRVLTTRKDDHVGVFVNSDGELHAQIAA